MDCNRAMGVSAGDFFATVILAFALSLMVVFDLDAEVSFFTTALVAAIVEEVATGEEITDIRFPFVTRRIEQRLIGAALE